MKKDIRCVIGLHCYHDTDIQDKTERKHNLLLKVTEYHGLCCRVGCQKDHIWSKSSKVVRRI